MESEVKYWPGKWVLGNRAIAWGWCGLYICRQLIYNSGLQQIARITVMDTPMAASIFVNAIAANITIYWLPCLSPASKINRECQIHMCTYAVLNMLVIT